MRISDWSSDVCSSDLGKRGLIEREKVRFPSYLRRQYPSRSVHGEADMGDALLTGCTGTCGIATIFFEMCQYQRLPRRLDIGRSLPALWRGDTFWRRLVRNDRARIDEIGRAHACTPVP